MKPKLKPGDILHSVDYPDIGVVKVEIVSVDETCYWYKYLGQHHIYPVSWDLFDLTIERDEYQVVNGD